MIFVPGILVLQLGARNSLPQFVSKFCAEWLTSEQGVRGMRYDLAGLQTARVAASTKFLAGSALVVCQTKQRRHHCALTMLSVSWPGAAGFASDLKTKAKPV